MKRVNIVGGDYSIAQMYLRNGWTVVSPLEDADLIQFTGGEDVHPSYYKEEKHPQTYANPSRDAAEWLVYKEHLGKTPMVGICRGAQLLNVFNGGKLWQHVTKHNHSGFHKAFDLTKSSPVTLEVTSTHHQMMIPASDAVVLMTAEQMGSKEGFSSKEVGGVSPDYEALFYPTTRSLCYQSHPEYLTDINHPCQTTFFDYINQFIFGGK